MKAFLCTISALATVLAFAGQADARGHHSGGSHSHGSFQARSAHRSYHAHSNHSGSSYYTNVSGRRVHRPMHASHAPRGASAHCGDGTYSFSEHRQGTCSHHGGVASWL